MRAKAMKFIPTIEKITTEGAELYCEHRGSGPLLLLITGGMGDAGFYSSAADILANEFTVLNYDRRCNSRSTGDRSVDMTVAQQTRDTAAIIKAMGEDKAIIFGSSGGGIISLELAAVNPNIIDFLIIHEAPVIELLPAADAEKWRSFHYDIYMKNLNEGWKAALVDCMASLIGAPDIPYPPDLNERVSQNMDFFFKHEYKAFIQYIPNVKQIRKNKVSMVAAIGRDSDDAYYVQSTRILASRLRYKCIEFPGQHDVSFYMPQEFANTIKNTLERQRGRRGERKKTVNS
jgi:pimeloyl-ACP methyl ester carboxylesterase